MKEDGKKRYNPMADSISPENPHSDEVTPQDLLPGNDKTETNKTSKDEYDEEFRRLQLENIKDQLKHKRDFFTMSTIIGISWLVFTGCIVYANGVENDWKKFSTSDSIVMRLIGSSIIAPLTLIGQSLFSRSKD